MIQYLQEQEQVDLEVKARKVATVLVNRINMAMGTAWQAETQRLTGNENLRTDLVIGCVDNRAARKAILDAVSRSGGGYWLDLGNRLHDGQVILGQVPSRWDKPSVERLPHAIDLLPEIGDETQEADDNKKGLHHCNPYVSWLPDLDSNQGPAD